MKRLISFVLTVVMTALVLPVMAYADGETADFQKEYEVLKALGIEIADYKSDEMMTRAKAAEIIMQLAGLTPQKSDYSGYFDVPSGHEHAAAIKSVTDAGLMRGTENGLFEPERTMTYAELARTLLVMLNYEMSAEARGGFTAGYMNIADRLKLSKGAGGLAADTGLDYGRFVKVVYNALEVEVLQVSSIGENIEYDTVDGETFAYKYFGAVKGVERVNATSRTAVSGQTVSDNEIRIGTLTIREGKCDGEKWLGYTVEYWAYEDNDIYELAYITASGDETVLNMRGDDIVGIKGQRVTWKDGGRERTFSMEEDMACIYNGSVISYTDEDLIPNDGEVEFVLDKTGRAVTAIVRDYRFGVVRSVNSSSNRVAFEDMSVLSLDDYEDWSIMKNGRSITVLELSSGDVLNILESRDGTLRADVSGGKVSGKITSVEDIDNRKVVYLEGKEDYQIVSPSYALADSELKLGLDGEWYTNILGDIFYAVKLKSGAMQYAYLVSYNEVSDDEVEDQIKLRLFTENDEFETVFSGDKVRVVDPEGGTSSRKTAKELKEYLDAFGADKLIKYTLNDDGTINKIQLPKTTYQKDEGKTNIGVYGASAFTLDYTADQAYFMVNLFDCSYLVSENAPVFRIPNDKNDEKAFSVSNRDSITKKLEYDVELYDINENYEVQACVINIAEATANYDWTTLRVAMVEKNKTVYLEEDSVSARELMVYQDGKALSIYCDDDNMKTATSAQSRYKDVAFKDLKPGDVIAYSADSSNMVKNFELMFSYSRENGDYFEYSIKSGVPSKTDYSSELYIGYGEVKAATAGGIVVNAHEKGTEQIWNHYFVLESRLTRTMLFESETGKWKTVPFNTVKKGDKVVIRMMGYGLWEVLIYE